MEQDRGPCDICGDFGWKEYLVICSKCLINCEHLYCMKDNLMAVPAEWYCERCCPTKNRVSPESFGQEDLPNSPDKVHHDVEHSRFPHKACIKSGQQVSSRKLKAVETGKVKFLPIEDVLRLSSRLATLGSPQSGKFSFNCDLSNHTEPRSRRTHTRSKTVTHEFSCLREKAIPSAVSLQFTESPTDGDAQAATNTQAPTNTMMNHQATKVFKKSKGETSLHVEHKRFAGEERELSNIPPKFELYRKYLPALEATWNGGFELSDIVVPGKFYGGFRAQPPCRLYDRAFEFGQKLPQTLQVDLLPRWHHWEDLFGNDVPDLRYIALYFFPADNTQRNQNKICLFELLEFNNLLMRCSIDGAELFIFSSKQLHLDSQRIIGRTNTDYFLWGVFRHVKAVQILHKVHEQLPSLAFPTECASDDQENLNNTEPIDMDIDMEGGRIVGTSDVVVSKQLSGRICRNQGKESADSASEQILLEYNQGSNYSYSPAKFSKKINREIDFEHLMESSRGKLANAKDMIGHPPGFAERLLVDKGFINHIKADIGHQESECDLAYDPFAAYPSPLSEKSRTGMEVKAEGNDYNEKEMEAVLFPSEHNVSSNREEHAADKNRYHPPYLEEVNDQKKIDIPVCWSPPQKGWVKLNIKGSSAGASGIVRDESGKWILGYTENIGNCQSVAAELRSLYQGLKLVWNEGFRKVQVESVCCEAIECLKQIPAFLDPNRAYIECCRAMLERDWNCKVKHTHREGNICANRLATHVEHQPLGKLAVFESPPSNLVPLLQNDCTMVAQPHPY